MPVESPFRTEVTVEGMSCDHCVMSVTEELTAIDGVREVDVVLATGAVAVLADREIGRAEIAATLDAVGYEVRD
jgi:copper chaperone CopZ